MAPIKTLIRILYWIVCCGQERIPIYVCPPSTKRYKTPAAEEDDNNKNLYAMVMILCLLGFML